MGSFNQTPFLSNIRLSADCDTVLFFLVRNNPTKPAVNTTDAFIPAFLPIFGKYDTYGKIEDIVEDANVRFIENHFGGIPIAKIVRGVYDNMVRDPSGFKVPKNDDLFQTLIFTMEHQFYYDKMISTQDSWFKHGDSSSYSVEKLFGLKPSGNVSDHERYNIIYDIPGCKDYYIRSDSRWFELSDTNGIAVNINKLTNGKIFSIYNPEDMINLLKFLGHTVKLSAKHRKITKMQIRYDATLIAQDERKKELGMIITNALKKHKGDPLKVDADISAKQYKLRQDMESDYMGVAIIGTTIRGECPAVSTYVKAGVFSDSNLKKNLLDFLHFNDTMERQGMTYKLSSYANEETCWADSMELSQACVDYCKSRIQEEDEW